MVVVSISEKGVSKKDDFDGTHVGNPKNNGVSCKSDLRKPRLRQVSSRYLSSSSSPSPSTSTITTTTTTSSSTCSSANSSKMRCPSPLISRSVKESKPAVGTPLPGLGALKRSQSVDRRRPVSCSRAMTPGLDSRPSNVDNVGEVLGLSTASKLLFTSTRSLSVSFQGEAFSLPISKAKVPNSNSSSLRKGTPERRRDTPLRGKIDGTGVGGVGGGGGGNNVENSKPIDQRRWPGKIRQASLLTKSFECKDDWNKFIGSDVMGSGRTIPQQSLIDESSERGSFDARLSLDLSSAELLKHSLIDESRSRGSFDGRLSLDSGNSAEFFKAVQHNPDGVSATLSFDLSASDTDSVSSDSMSGKQECAGIVSGRQSDPRRMVSARFWQETNSRLRRLQDPGSPLSTSPRSRTFGLQKSLQSKRFLCDSPLSSSPRTIPSPTRGAMRPASPSKLVTPVVSSSPLRGNPSPSRVRNTMATSLNSSSNHVVSILSFSADLRSGKIGENRIVDAHLLRLLYNRYLQWRFVNARAEAAFSLQKRSAEKNQWNAWITISELRRSVTIKRSRLLLLKQKLKLSSILKGQLYGYDKLPKILVWAYMDLAFLPQILTEKRVAFLRIDVSLQMICLEEWALLDREYSSSLVAATEALKASTLRLPIIGKTVADIQSLKDAIGSAVDVMQAMGSSIFSLLSKVEQVNSLLTELVNATTKEQSLLVHCKRSLCTVTSMQVKDCSLRTHILQLGRIPNTGTV